MRPEILAPAGSMEALKAAVRAGADAIYLGGNRFGARAFANNFDNAALLEAIEYCHLYGVKVYLTVNTLFHNEELTYLYDYLNPLYEAGLDAVIVQDFGVMVYIHKQFPNMEIHASTQMTITTKYAYSLLKSYGVTRIVPARELSVEEIASLKEQGVPEVEVFVQGALCYCYSGQCLMSSMLGGRSGNRGRCAQTCRLPYELVESENRIGTKGAHLLSPKDLCGLDAIPELIEAGVDSFKIEGRMKKPEYVAVCVRAYRKAVDAFYEGMLTQNLLDELRKEMAEVFNRGGFTEGYYHKHNGKDMMSIKAPGNVGIRIGKITKINKNQIQISLEQSVSKGDLFVFENEKGDFPLTCNTDAKKGNMIMLNVPKGRRPQVGMNVARVHNALLQQDMEPYLNVDNDILIRGEIALVEGQAASLTISRMHSDSEISVTVFGSVVESATKQPLSEDVVLSKIQQTGNTRYKFAKCDVVMSQSAFYSLKELKELRRNAIEQLEEKMIQQSRRTSVLLVSEPMKDVTIKNSSCMDRQTSVMVSTKEQYQVIKENAGIHRIYLDLQYLDKQDVFRILEEDTTNMLYIALPAILREHSFTETKEIIQYVMKHNLSHVGFVVRNIDELAYLKECGYSGAVIADESLYAMNYQAVNFLRQVFPQVEVTLPVELNKKQIENWLSLSLVEGEMKVYGYQPLMVSAQCLQNTTRYCNHQQNKFTLIDRYQKHFTVACVCKYCYNLIYNGTPTTLYDVVENDFGDTVRMRLHFTKETPEETRQILNLYYDKDVSVLDKTRGHYNRGVE